MRMLPGKSALILAILAVLCLTASPSFALVQTFFGEDLGVGENTRLTSHPNSDAAKSDFFSNLTGVGTEDFEGFATGSGTPLAASFGSAGTATLQGGGEVETVASGTNGFGRYPISGDNYWDTDSGSFNLSFSDSVAAFGFYGIDFGDFNGQITATTSNGVSSTYEIPHKVGAPGGSVVYWGLIDTDNLFTSLAFDNTGSGADFFGFDDFSIGSLEQVTPGGPSQPVPEPGTMLLLGSGLLGMGFLARKRFMKQS